MNGDFYNFTKGRIKCCAALNDFIVVATQFDCQFLLNCIGNKLLEGDRPLSK
nr:hypothetical protein HmN_000805200 [Hymenolepis microstoma]